MMSVKEIWRMFRTMGLKEPSVIYMPFGQWSEEGIPVWTPEEEAVHTAEAALNPPRYCTCCSCYFEVGPPGCDGTNCRNCGGPH